MVQVLVNNKYLSLSPLLNCDCYLQICTLLVTHGRPAQVCPWPWVRGTSHCLPHLLGNMAFLGLSYSPRNTMMPGHATMLGHAAMPGQATMSGHAAMPKHGSIPGYDTMPGHATMPRPGSMPGHAAMPTPANMHDAGTHWCACPWHSMVFMSLSTKLHVRMQALNEMWTCRRMYTQSSQRVNAQHIHEEASPLEKYTHTHLTY